MASNDAWPDVVLYSSSALYMYTKTCEGGGVEIALLQYNSVLIPSKYYSRDSVVQLGSIFGIFYIIFG